jgi:phage shock protein C
VADAKNRGVNKMAKKLMKSRDDVKLDGVCAGIAEYFNIDPTLIRVLFVFISLSGGAGLLLYLILAIVMPRNEGRTRGRRDDYDEYRQTKTFDDEDQDSYNKVDNTEDANASKNDPDEEESWRDF